MHVDADSPDHPYVQIANWLRAEIEAGRMGPRLPPVLALAGRTDTSVNTVRKALAVLAEEGLVVMVEGRGTFVIRRD